MPAQGGTAKRAKALTSAVINASSSGDNILVAAVEAQTTRVHRIILVAAGTVSVGFKCGSTVKMQPVPMVANQQLILEFSDEPYFVTAENEAFNVNLSGAVAVTGMIEYTTGATLIQV